MTWLLISLWIVWYLYWIYLGLQRKPEATPKAEQPPMWRYLIPLYVSYALLLVYIPALTIIAFPVTGILLTAIGLAFACWARHTLQDNWNALLTIQQDHRLITTGPYAMVRHGIYAGMLLAFAGTALWHGTLTSFLAPFIAYIGIAYKIRIEEAQLRETFPEYDEYASTTPSLIPFPSKYGYASH